MLNPKTLLNRQNLRLKIEKRILFYYNRNCIYVPWPFLNQIEWLGDDLKWWRSQNKNKLWCCMKVNNYDLNSWTNEGKYSFQNIYFICMYFVLWPSTFDSSWLFSFIFCNARRAHMRPLKIFNYSLKTSNFFGGNRFNSNNQNDDSNNNGNNNTRPPYRGGYQGQRRGNSWFQNQKKVYFNFI